MISLFGKNEPEPTLLEKLKASVSKTKAALSETVDTIFLGERKIDPALLKQLETALLSADLGVRTTREILDAVREKMDRNALSDASQLKREIKSHIVRILAASGGSTGAATVPIGRRGGSVAERQRAARDLYRGREWRGQDDQHRKARQSLAQGWAERDALRRRHLSRRRG